MLDAFRERPRETLTGIIQRQRERDSTWETPASVRLLEWMFLRDAKRRDWLGDLALRLLQTRRFSPSRDQSSEESHQPLRSAKIPVGLSRWDADVSTLSIWLRLFP